MKDLEVSKGVETRNIFIFRHNVFRVVHLTGVETRNISRKIFRLLSIDGISMVILCVSTTTRSVASLLPHINLPGQNLMFEKNYIRL